MSRNKEERHTKAKGFMHQTTFSEVGKKTLVFDWKHFGEKTNLFEPWQSCMYTLHFITEYSLVHK